MDYLDLDGAVRRAQLTAKRNALLLAESQAHRSRIALQESLYGGYPYTGGFGEIVNPLGQFFDGPVPFVSALFQRRVGSNSIGISESQLDLIRLYARYLYDTHPIGQGVVRGKRNYIFGTGFKYTIAAKPRERVADKLIDQAQGILDDFLEANRWHHREPERYTRALRDGESILRITPDDDDDCCARVRTIEPEQVRAPDPSPEWWGGIHTAEGDREHVLGYGVTIAGDGSDWEEVPAEEVSFLKIGTDIAVPRGLSGFFTSQQIIIGAQKLLAAGIDGESVRQAIAFVRQHAQADAVAANNLARMNDDEETRVPTQSGPRSIPTERVVPGSVHDIPASLEMMPPPIGSATNATALLAAAYQALSVCFQVPQWMVSGDTGNTNFAASLTAESPLVKDTEVEQQFHGNENIALFRKVLKIAEDQERLPKGTVRRLAIYAEYPSPAVRDAQKETAQNKILSDAGLLSDQTWSEREDLDFEQEKAQGAKKVVTAQPGAGAPSTNPSAVYSSEAPR